MNSPEEIKHEQILNENATTTPNTPPTLTRQSILSSLIKPHDFNSKKTSITREQIANWQTLEIEIEAEFNPIINKIKEITGTNIEPRPDGFHLTIIGPTESKILSTLDDNLLEELQQINKAVQNGDGIDVKGIGFIDGASSTYQMREVDKTKKTAFIALEIPSLQAFRAKIGLPPKDFHVTLGFEGGDVHMHVVGQEIIKPGSPKMKDITNPIPKKADPRFSEITLPEISYHGLDGQQKK
jgi:hypothetical protein